MKKALSFILILVASAASLAAKPAPVPRPQIIFADSAAAFQYFADSVDATFRYQTGRVALPGGRGQLTVPAGFHYLDSTQSSYVLHKLWHNPRQTNLGMLFPTDAAPMGAKSWGYIIEFDPIGYVKDDRAGDLNYDNLLEDMQQEAEARNPERVETGYAPLHVYGWGAKPYYDQQRHTLHWAKLLRFGSDLEQTLNYNVRVLGRRGVLVFNAIAEPKYLPEIKASIPALLANVQFVRGEQYGDFDSAKDEVAAYSVGGLIAGKTLASTGLMALAAQYWKAALLVLGAVLTVVRRFQVLASRTDKREA